MKGEINRMSKVQTELPNMVMALLTYLESRKGGFCGKGWLGGIDAEGHRIRVRTGITQEKIVWQTDLVQREGKIDNCKC